MSELKMAQVGGSPISITETFFSLFFQADPPTASSDLYFHQAAAYCFAL